MPAAPFPPKTPLGRRVRVLVALNRLLVRSGLVPSSAKAGSIPVAKRLAMKPPAWALLRATGHPLVEDRVIAGRHGDIPLRVYLPEGGVRSPVSLLYVHGGGFTVGGLDSLDWFCRELSTRVGLAVVSVEYRLSPDVRYPVPLDDVTDALDWLAAHLDEFGASSLAVAGDSAGGNLAAAVCRRAREAGGPPVRAQVLIYPGLDGTFSSPSMGDRAGGLTLADIHVVYENYVGEGDAGLPEVSPLLAPDKAGLPPALVITAEHDLLRDEGRLYAEQLAAAGVPARCVEYAGVDHGFLSVPALSRKQSIAALELVAAELQSLARGGRP